MTKLLSEYLAGKTMALGKMKMNQWLDMQTTCLFPSIVNTNTARPSTIIIRHPFTAARLLLDTNIDSLYSVGLFYPFDCFRFNKIT